MKSAFIAAAAALFLATSAWSQPYGMGPGMMGGYGPGFGMGPGMMEGYGGYGPGYGMGPGMMWGYGGGYGIGPGMMWGYGPGGYGYGIPDLTGEQRTKMAEIQNEFGKKQWALMQSMRELAWNQGGVSRGSEFDEKAARKAFDAMSDLRKQMFENSLEARKRMDSVLTSQQRKQLSGR
jgi:Spy/CpxP family protein refolding chaperone